MEKRKDTKPDGSNAVVTGEEPTVNKRKTVQKLTDVDQENVKTNTEPATQYKRINNFLASVVIILFGAAAL